MTAMSLIVRPEAAYLLTDTACYARDGKIIEFRPKVVELHIGDRVPLALASTGMCHWSDFSDNIQRQKADCAGDLLVALPDMFREVERRLITRGKIRACGDGHMSLALAGWDHVTGRAAGFVISNDNQLFPASAYTPYQLIPVAKHLTRWAGEPFPSGTDVCDPASWNPYSDSEALIEAQRADPFGDEDCTFTGIGGQAVLTRVDGAGVDYHLVKSWDDRRGEQIGKRLERRRGFSHRHRKPDNARAD